MGSMRYAVRLWRGAGCGRRLGWMHPPPPGCYYFTTMGKKTLFLPGSGCGSRFVGNTVAVGVRTITMGVLVAVAVGVGVGLAVGVWDGSGVTLGVALGVSPGSAVSVAVGGSVAVSVGLAVAVAMGGSGSPGRSGVLVGVASGELTHGCTSPILSSA